MVLAAGRDDGEARLLCQRAREPCWHALLLLGWAPPSHREGVGVDEVRLESQTRNHERMGPPRPSRQGTIQRLWIAFRTSGV